MDLNKIVGNFRRKTKLTSGKNISIKVLRMSEGVSVGKKLLNVVAPAIGGTLDGLKHNEYLHGAPKSFSHLALMLCDQIEKVQVEDLIVVLLNEMLVEDNEIDIEDFFAGNYGELIEVLEFALKENFSSLFTAGGIKARLGKTYQMLMAQTTQESEEQ